MNTNEFDQLLNDKFGEHEFAYKETSWQMLSQQLPVSRGKAIALPWLKVSGIAASLAIITGAAGWYYSTNRHVDSAINGPTLVTTTGRAEPANQVPAMQENQAPEQTSQTSASLTATRRNQPVHSNFTINKKTNASDNTATFPLVAQSNSNPEAQLAMQKPQQVVAADEPKIAANSGTESAPKVLQGTQNYPDVVLDQPILIPKQDKTQFSLTGGMNYGSMNTGYAAGVNARRKLSSKVFVEGDLAFVNNTASQTLDKMPSPTPVGSGKAPPDYKTASLYYVQFNPTVGYQVLKNVSLGVGADVQRMLNGDNTLVDVNDEIKTIPGTDVGLTGKTEISLSRKLKAGVLYREGINNVINSGGNYFDRRYMQIQLKFTLLGK